MQSVNDKVTAIVLLFVFCADVQSDAKENGFSLVGGGDHSDFMQLQSVASSKCTMCILFSGSLLYNFTTRSELHKVLFLALSVTFLFVMATLWNRAGHYIFAMVSFFLLLLFFFT